MWKTYGRNKKGFTLIEILVATTLILIVMSSFILVFQSGLNLKVNSQRRLEALTLAQTTIEEIKNNHGTTQSTWKDMSGLEVWLEGQGYSNPSPNVYTDGEVWVTLTAVQLDPISTKEEMTDIKVSVSYPDKLHKGVPKSVSLRTMLRSF